jgi:hypothetical protein
MQNQILGGLLRHVYCSPGICFTITSLDSTADPKCEYTLTPADLPSGGLLNKSLLLLKVFGIAGEWTNTSLK